MESRPLKVDDGEISAPAATLVGLPTHERWERLTHSLDAAERAIADLGDSTSRTFGTTIEDLAALRDRLAAELATMRGDEWAARLMPHTPTSDV
jgi:hypothetical protein